MNISRAAVRLCALPEGKEHYEMEANPNEQAPEFLYVKQAILKPEEK